MKVRRTKRLTLDRALKILQLRFGTQVRRVTRHNDIYIADSILCENRGFTRNAILTIEDKMYSAFGA